MALGSRQLSGGRDERDRRKVGSKNLKDWGVGCAAEMGQ